MKKILFIAGPALGHISRLLTIASALRDLADVNIRFAIPDRSRFLSLILESGFSLSAIPHQVNTASFEGFADEIERLLSSEKFDLILCDIEPVGWQSVIDWPSIPRILVTNVFLAQAGAQTVQQRKFSNLKEVINTIRRAKGLKGLESPDPLYDADEVLFADPQPLVDQFRLQNEKQKSCGACFWELPGELPVDLLAIRNVLLASMGSTGHIGMLPDLINRLARFCGAVEMVYVGPCAPEESELEVKCHSYQQLPFAPLLQNAALAITQGGSGSTYQALSNGVPVVVVPTHRNHQILGELIEELGVGLVIGNDDTPEKLKNFDFQKMRANAIVFASKMKDQNGPNFVARRILEQLS